MTRISDTLLVQRVDDLAVLIDEGHGYEFEVDEANVGAVRVALAGLFPDADGAPYAALNLALLSIRVTDDSLAVTDDEDDQRVLDALEPLDEEALRRLSFACSVVRSLALAKLVERREAR